MTYLELSDAIGDKLVDEATPQQFIDVLYAGKAAQEIDQLLRSLGATNHQLAITYAVLGGAGLLMLQDEQDTQKGATDEQPFYRGLSETTAPVSR